MDQSLRRRIGRLGGGRVGELNANIRAGGFRGAFGWAASEIGHKNGPQPSRKRPRFPRVKLRYGTTDVHVHTQMADLDQYALPEQLRLLRPELIIDAGANIGLASVAFALRFPEARVVAVEPHPESFAMLCANVAEFPQVLPVRGGVAGASGRLQILDPDDLPSSIRVGTVDADAVDAESDGAGSIPAYTIPELIRLGDAEQVDLLKLDVEGSERDVLAGSSEWIGGTGAIVAELHDWLTPGCTDAWQQATEGAWHRWNGGETGEVVGAALPASAGND